MFREHVIGGLVNCFLRHASTYDQPDIPKSARYAANGDPFTYVIMLDFNSMYLSCQAQDMPTSPGILWEKCQGSRWKKNIMTTGHSFKAQQWLTYLQQTDPFLKNNDGSRAVIQTKFHRGEKRIPSSKMLKDWKVDGYVKSDQGVKIYEFMGDHWHDGCPNCDPTGIDVNWSMKLRDISQVGIVEVIWECEFDELLTRLRGFWSPLIPHIFDEYHSQLAIKKSIMKNELYGYILCDIDTPDHLVESMSNFPPVIKRMTLTDEHLTPYMRQRHAERYPNKQMSRTTVVQCFKATQHLLLTRLAKFYMEQGLVISNITKVVQYIPRKSLKPFVEHVTNMRIDAEKARKRTKANSAKTFGNAGYGKVKYKYCQKI